MTVTGIEAVTKTKSKVFLDGQFAFVLYKGELSRYRIKAGEELEEETVRKILVEIIFKRAKLRAMHLLEDMDRSEAGLREKLRTGLYPQEAIDQAVEYVKSFGYLDDRRFARNFVQSRLHTKSRKEIYYQLCQKGIPGEIAQEAMELSATEDDEREAVLAIMRKKRVNPATAEPEQMNKLLGYLARKGFRYETIRQVIQNYDENA